MENQIYPVVIVQSEERVPIRAWIIRHLIAFVVGFVIVWFAYPFVMH